MADAWRTIDLWAQINGGEQLTAEERAARQSAFPPVGMIYSPPEGVILGQSHRDDVLAHCGIKPKKLVWQQRSPDAFEGAEAWPYAQIDALCLYFDAKGRWHGLNWDAGTDAGSLVHWNALAEREASDADDVVAGKLRLLLNGAGMRRYVGLADFAALLSRRRLTFALAGMGYDKWLRLEASGVSGTIAAEFKLQSLKAQYASRFEIDYFLTSITILSHALGGGRPASEIGAQTAG